MWPFGKRKPLDPHGPEEELRHRIVRLDGEITDATAQVALAQLLFMQHEDDRQPITLRVASPGGSVAAGMAIVDTVRELRPPIRTRAPAVAHGMAAVVLASGRKGERVVGPASELSLTPIENAAGPSTDVVRLRHQLAGVVAELCGQLPELVAQDLLVGRLFTPDEAVAYGLADRVGE
jgi:ATP-dependent Clp protease, protease subunit